MAALTLLSEDESLFHASVLEFARRDIAPHVRAMDEAAQLAPGLLEKLFALGVMGIEIPESLGGGGATFFHSVLAVEALARVDPSVERARRRAEHAGHQRAGPLGQRRDQSSAICRGWPPTRSAPTRCRKPARAATPSR